MEQMSNADQSTGGNRQNMSQSYEGDEAARANSNKRKGREEINMAID